MARIRSLLPIIWLMALLVLPVTAYLVGARQPLLENREKTAFPDLNRGTLRQEHTYQQLDAALRERLPLRGDAIELRGQIAIDLFGDSPTADVVLGKDRWLYYRPELRLCTPGALPTVQPEDAAAMLTRVISASGRRPVVIVAGSKILTHGEHLKGVDADDLACAAALESRVHERLAELPGGYSIQGELDRLEAEGRPTFLRSDTHWNVLGREVFARTVLDGVRPGLAAEARLRPVGNPDRPGDLGVFIGQDRVDRDPLLTVTGSPTTTFKPGEVLFVGDSQLETTFQRPGADGASIMDRVFPGQSICDWSRMQNDGCADPMVAARTVVIESVARNLDQLVNSCWRPVSALAPSIPGRPARWAGGATRASAAPTPTPMRVEVDDDQTDVPRLIRIPVRVLPPDPAADPASPPTVTALPPGPRPCALPSTSSLETSILIPIAADERVSDVELQVTGPAGSELGRPELLVLDGATQAQR